MNKRELAKRQKARHLQALETLGFKASQFNRLRQIEKETRQEALRWCNGEITTEQWYTVEDAAISNILRLLAPSPLPVGFFINSDPRGSALKLDDDKTKIPAGLRTDMGGYGIIAPEF